MLYSLETSERNCSWDAGSGSSYLSMFFWSSSPFASKALFWEFSGESWSKSSVVGLGRSFSVLSVLPIG